MRHFFPAWVFGPFLCAAVASAGPMDGVWRGELHRRSVYETRYHRVVYEEDLALMLRVTGQTVGGQGTAHLSAPVITRIRNDPRYAQWAATYLPNDFSLSVSGSLQGKGKASVLVLALAPTEPVRIRFRYHDGEGARTEEVFALTRLAPQRLPWLRSRIDHLSLRRGAARGDDINVPTDLAYFGEEVLEAEFQTDGSFEEIKPPARRLSAKATLALILAYLVLIIPGLIAVPASGAYLAALGTLLGALPALQSLGLGWTAQMAQWGGWGAAALILVLEAGRVHQLSQAAREKPWKTTARVFASAMFDLAALVGSFWMVTAVLRIVIGSASRIGPAAAMGASLACAVLCTYIIALIARSAKHRVLSLDHSPLP